MQRVKKEIILGIVGFLLSVFFVASAWAVPGLINYQGKLLQNGVPLTTVTPVSMTFKIFIEETDTGGSPIWMEYQDVDVVDGIYTVKLGVGTGTPLDSSLFEDSGRDYWLEVTVGTETLLPRQRLTSVIFALQAENAATLDGYTATELDQSAHVTSTDNPHNVTAAQIGAATMTDLTWGNLSGIPGDLADGDDVGITAEADPTVLASVKDGISWSEVTGIPAGFADGEDNNSGGDITGVTAGTGLIGGGSSGDVTLEVKSPLNLSGDLTVANNLGIGLLNPNKKLYVMDDIAGLAFSLKIENHAAGDEPGESDVGILFSTGGSGSGDRGKGALVYETTGTWNRGSFHFLQESGANANNPDMADSVMTISNSGNVGIGLRDPSSKLEVAGSIDADVTTTLLSPLPGGDDIPEYKYSAVHGHAIGTYYSTIETWSHCYGGYFNTSTPGGLGVYAESTSTIGANANGGGSGGYFLSHPTAGYGVYAKATGISGKGMYALATRRFGQAVYGVAEGDSGIAIHGMVSGLSARAGYFEGDVEITGNLELTPGTDRSILLPDATKTLFIGGKSSETTVPWGIMSESKGYIGFTVDGEDIGRIDTNGLRITGQTTTSVLQITGGSDLSEQFDIDDSEMFPEPGMLVSIDLEIPGRLKVSNEAYDKKVAGIISGAGGINTGMVMGQADSAADGEYPIALTGRVYCCADASYGKIVPGDMLTTSPTPGYAMKVADFQKAHGTIVGKAMQGLDKGEKGMILVLVTLQ